MKGIEIQNQLISKQLFIFDRQEFERVFKTSGRTTMHYLETGVEEGLFLRLKRGLYALKTHLPAEEIIANRLYRPSYLSFEYALAFHGIIPEMVYQITSATTKTTQSFTIEEKTFTYLSIKQGAYTGYYLHKQDSKSFLIAEPEKALVDFLYFVTLNHKQPNERLYVENLDRNKATNYAHLFNNAVVKLLGSYQ
jgi:predicted transcriptional regulator of viral defense system